jgi:hypothetical protein
MAQSLACKTPHCTPPLPTPKPNPTPGTKYLFAEGCHANPMCTRSVSPLPGQKPFQSKGVVHGAKAAFLQ